MPKQNRTTTAKIKAKKGLAVKRGGAQTWGPLS